MDKYQTAAEKLAKAIDLQIESIHKYPPKSMTAEQISTIINSTLELKKLALKPDKKFRTIASLNYLEKDVLTYFQEGTGAHIEYFWNKVKECELGYERKDMLAAILKKKRISNTSEYELVVDSIVAAQQEGRITEEQAELLSSYIGVYEKKGKGK